MWRDWIDDRWATRGLIFLFFILKKNIAQFIKWKNLAWAKPSADEKLTGWSLSSLFVRQEGYVAERKIVLIFLTSHCFAATHFARKGGEWNAFPCYREFQFPMIVAKCWISLSGNTSQLRGILLLYKQVTHVHNWEIKKKKKQK